MNKTNPTSAKIMSYADKINTAIEKIDALKADVDTSKLKAECAYLYDLAYNIDQGIVKILGCPVPLN